MSLLNKNIEVVEASLSVPLNMLKRYNINIDGKRTSVTLEPKTWEVLKDICRYEKMTIHEICSLIASRKDGKANMSSAIRVFLISYLYARLKYIGE